MSSCHDLIALSTHISLPNRNVSSQGNQQIIEINDGPCKDFVHTAKILQFPSRDPQTKSPRPHHQPPIIAATVRPAASQQKTIKKTTKDNNKQQSDAFFRDPMPTRMPSKVQASSGCLRSGLRCPLGCPSDAPRALGP